LALLKYFMNI